MWPFAGIITAPSFELLMPGQDSPYSISKFGSGVVYAGIRLNSDGSIDIRGSGSGTYTEILSPANTWIHEDARGAFDILDYEWYCNQISGDTISGDVHAGAWVSFGTTPNPKWSVIASGLFDSKSARLIVGVRLAANPGATTKSGTIDLDAQEFGL